MREQEMKRINQVVADGPYEDTWQSLSGYSIPQWYKDAKFGIFIHWGVYSVPAFGSEWYPRFMYCPENKRIFSHHIETYGPQDQFGYKDFIPMFKAERYDPVQWAQLFKDAGARFVMPVAEHHDGFQLYDSKLSEWNAVKMGPKRDLVGELKQAVEAEEMVFAASSHRAENFWFFGGGREFPSDVQDPAYRGLYGPAQAKAQDKEDELHLPEPDADFLEDWLLRTCELVDKYQPQIVWFDWWIRNVAFKPYLKKFAAYYYNRATAWGKEVAINYKFDAFMYGTAVFDVERGQLADIRPEFWQTDTAVAKNSWSYTQNNDYKAPAALIGDLIDIVSKNGALLLNIGPKADGTIPEEDASILRAIGQWLKVHGEGIYNTTHWKIYGEGPVQIEEGMHTESKRKDYTSEDIRFTFKDGVLYAFALKWPTSGRIVIRSLGTAAKKFTSVIRQISRLGYADALQWERTEEALVIDVSQTETSAYPVGLKIVLD